MDASNAKGPIFVLTADEQLAGDAQLDLQAAGFCVFPFGEMRPMLQSWEQAPPEVFLMDGAFNRITGFELCELMRTGLSGKVVPIVMLVDADEHNALTRARQVGADDLVTLPYDPEELVACVESRYAMARLRRARIGRFSDGQEQPAAKPASRGRRSGTASRLPPPPPEMALSQGSPDKSFTLVLPPRPEQDTEPSPKPTAIPIVSAAFPKPASVSAAAAQKSADIAVAVMPSMVPPVVNTVPVINSRHYASVSGLSPKPPISTITIPLLAPPPLPPVAVQTVPVAEQKSRTAAPVAADPVVTADRKWSPVAARLIRLTTDVPRLAVTPPPIPASAVRRGLDAPPPLPVEPQRDETDSKPKAAPPDPAPEPSVTEVVAPDVAPVLLKSEPIAEVGPGSSAKELPPISVARDVPAWQPGQPVQVLLADPDFVVRDLLAYHLKRAGWTVRTAIDGEEAERLLKQEPPTIAILDANLPFRNAYEIISHVLNNGGPYETRYVVLSSQSQDQNVLRSFSVGSDEFIAKPFNPQVVVSRLQHMLQNRSREGSRRT